MGKARVTNLIRHRYREAYALTSVDFLEDQVKAFRLLKVLDELNYIFVAAAVVKHLYLLEDTCSAVSRHLLDDFDGVLDVGPDIASRSNGRVGTLAKHFPCEVVELVERGSDRGRVGLLLLSAPRLGLLLALVQQIVGVGDGVH